MVRPRGLTFACAMSLWLMEPLAVAAMQPRVAARSSKTKRRPATRPPGQGPAITGAEEQAAETSSARADSAAERGPDEDIAVPATRVSAASTAPMGLVSPRTVAMAVAGTLVGRTFRWDAPLQREDSFPRPGVLATIESFPLRAFDVGFARRIGLGVTFAKETGKAVISQTATTETRLPVTEQRWSAEGRLAFVPLPWLTLVPAAGMGHLTYGVQDALQALPSQCQSASADICLPRVQMTHVTAGLDARAAVSPRLAVFASTRALAAVRLDGTPGALAAEANVRTRGFAGELGGMWALNDWLGLRASVLMTRLSHSFTSEQPIGYSQASETYYAFALGASVAFGP